MNQVKDEFELAQQITKKFKLNANPGKEQLLQKINIKIVKISLWLKLGPINELDY